MIERRKYVLYFHGPDGRLEPVPVGQVVAPCAEQALEVFAERALETALCVDGLWCCCSGAHAIEPASAAHPACCQTQFTVTAQGIVKDVTPVN